MMTSTTQVLHIHLDHNLHAMCTVCMDNASGDSKLYATFIVFFFRAYMLCTTADWTVLCQEPTDQSVKNLPTFASEYGYSALFAPVETAEEVLGQESYVNLLENPERFTGYSGEPSHRIWRAIKDENCFGALSDVCLEKRIFFRYIIYQNMHVVVCDYQLFMVVLFSLVYCCCTHLTAG